MLRKATMIIRKKKFDIWLERNRKGGGDAGVTKDGTRHSMRSVENDDLTCKKGRELEHEGRIIR